MSAATVLDLTRQALLACLLVAAPLLITALVVGVLVSILQAVTQIQEQTLTFVPKLAAVAGAFLLALPWMLGYLTTYLVETIRSISVLTR
jgi:flagellar biosynthetic protein FliQ